MAAEPQTLIAVRDVRASSRWYAELLAGESLPDHPHRDLYDRIHCSDRLVLQLHAWDVEKHPISTRHPNIRKCGCAIPTAMLW